MPRHVNTASPRAGPIASVWHSGGDPAWVVADVSDRSQCGPSMSSAAVGDDGPRAWSPTIRGEFDPGGGRVIRVPHPTRQPADRRDECDPGGGPTIRLREGSRSPADGPRWSRPGRRLRHPVMAAAAIATFGQEPAVPTRMIDGAARDQSWPLRCSRIGRRLTWGSDAESLADRVRVGVGARVASRIGRPTTRVFASEAAAPGAAVRSRAGIGKDRE